MCGIVGIHSLGDRPVSAEEVAAMADSIVHRGPDDCGYFVAPGLGLGMRRLSIIDLETGKQPICNEDSSVWIVLNGEIYNFREKRRELEARGHRFRTAADTEVIVHLYEEYGLDCVDHLRGMFAFALWDTRTRSLLLARDRIGIKPLYYGVFGDRLVFGSEVKSLLTLPEVRQQLDFDWRAVQHLFTFLATAPTRSIVEGIRKLEPGHILTVTDGRGPTLKRYWDLRFEPGPPRSEDEIVEELVAVLEEAVDLHMVSDVPLGAFLSGGMDSSAVVAMMAKLARRPVKTFSIGFGVADFDELEHARVMANQLGTDHRELVLEPDVFDVLDDLAWYLDEPFGDSSAIPTYMVSKLAARDVTVVLSGDGGDEVFGGYDKYVVEGRERRLESLLRLARPALGVAASMMPDDVRGKNLLRHFSLSGSDRYLDACSFFPPREQAKLFTGEVQALMPAEGAWRAQKQNLSRGSKDWLSALQYNDFHGYLPLDILTKVDRMSMAHSIETRVPLLDHVLVETAARIPSALLIKDSQTKYILKKAMRGTLPESIVNRRKQGFAIPLGHWFRGQLSNHVRELLLSSTARSRGIFEPRYVERLIERHEQGRPLDLHIWTLMSFELWCRTFLDTDAGARGTAAGPRRAANEVVENTHEAAL